MRYVYFTFSFLFFFVKKVFSSKKFFNIKSFFHIKTFFSANNVCFVKNTNIFSKKNFFFNLVLQQMNKHIFKPINGLNPNFIKDILSFKLNAIVRPNAILKAHKSATFEDKSLITQGPEILNALTQNIKAETSYHRYKK